MHRIRVVIVLALALSAVPNISGAGPITQDPCAGTIVGPTVWKQLGNDVLENLLFAAGSLWVSDQTASSVRRFDAGGSESAGLTGIPSPGGLAEGPDGLIYAGWGNSAVNALTRNGQGEVVRFDPASPQNPIAVYAAGFNMPNGMTFGPNGDLYISNDFDFGLILIPRNAPERWAEFAHVWGTNGLVIDPAGENLYANITFDQRSPIERVPLADPASHSTAVELTFGVASLEPAVYTNSNANAPLVGLKGLDDITRDEQGILYPVANGMGELLRVDSTTGEACLIASGFQNPSSVRIAPAGSDFDSSGQTMTFYVVEFSGAIRTVGYTPPH